MEKTARRTVYLREYPADFEKRQQQLASIENDCDPSTSSTAHYNEDNAFKFRKKHQTRYFYANDMDGSNENGSRFHDQKRMSEEDVRRQYQEAISCDYDTIPLSKHSYTFKLQHIVCSLPRAIIIDGANIMRLGSVVIDRRTKTCKPFPDVLALLAVMRYFVTHKFEVYAITLPSLHGKGVKGGRNYSNFSEGLDKMLEEGLVHVCNAAGDDETIIAFSHALNGIMISNDRYRDHKEADKQVNHSVLGNRVGIDFVDIPEEYRYTRSELNKHFTAAKSFQFMNDIGVMRPEDFQRSFFLSSDDNRYYALEERRKKFYTAKKQEEILGLLNSLILQGLEVYKKNTPRFLVEKLEGKRNKVEKFSNFQKING